MAYSIEKIRNICLLGHGGDGKTSLTESILYANKVTDRLGKVTDGNTVSDYDPEEIKRVISIQTSVCPVETGGYKINVLDAPGFFDFVGEVTEALRVSDAAVIVIGAKSGISVGAQKAWLNLKHEDKPCAIYISKLDEEHADFYKTYEEARSIFGISIAPIIIPIMENGTATGIINIVTKKAYQTANHKVTEIPIPASMEEKVEEYRSALAENVAETNDELMEKFFGFKPCALICFGIRYCCAILTFSSSVYPETSMTSILSRSGRGIVSMLFAVVMNITLDKSNGTSRK